MNRAGQEPCAMLTFNSEERNGDQERLEWSENYEGSQEVRLFHWRRSHPFDLGRCDVKAVTVIYKFRDCLSLLLPSLSLVCLPSPLPLPLLIPC